MNKPDVNFLNEKKAITFLGMSGVGKTYISQILSNDGWEAFSCDYEIGTRYLNQDIQDTLGISEQITVDNLGYLSQFVGQVGDPEQGGLSLAEFKRRQNLYYQAECRSLADACTLIDSTDNVLIDSTGSLCEIEDEKLIQTLVGKSLFIYLQASKEDEEELIKRAQEYPKPLFFPPSKFDEWLNEFLEERGLERPERMPPNEFARWVFPKLLAYRLPKYQSLADQYGITIPASEFKNLNSSGEFWQIVSKYLS